MPLPNSHKHHTINQEVGMAVSLAAPDYIGDLGNGLVRRWSTTADVEKIAHCMATVFRDGADDPLRESVANEARISFIPGYPLMGPNDFAVVEDTTLPDRPVVACTCYWRHRWSLGGIPFSVGRPEYVATRAEYRNRGLIRALFEMVHARSAVNGDLVQAITGIEYYYRQYGYDYALDLGGHRMVALTAVPPRKEDAPEPYRLRPATLDDVPDLQALYNARRNDSLVWAESTEEDWRWYITLWDDPIVRDVPPAVSGLAFRLHMVVDANERVCGFVAVAAKRRSKGLGIYYLELAPHSNWQAVMPSLLRALHELGKQTPTIQPDTPPLEDLTFVLGRAHPAYTVLGEKLAPRVTPPYTWYLRVPDIGGFLRHIAPVLEARLADSLLAGYDGELKINFYRGGLRLQLAGGKLTAVEPWRTPAYGDEANLSCPALTFLQLLFGYRSYAELHAFLPDVYAEDDALLLVNTLFPKQSSHVSSLSYT
jgi:GNAT superfamily N-acetyltransferase